jgi:hypothetical protein
VDQDRDHPFALPERRFYFDAHEIIGVVEPATSTFVFGVEPSLSDHRQERVATRHLRIQNVNEILPGGNIVDVDEQLLGRKGLLQAAEKRMREARLVTPSIIDENLAGHAVKHR